MSQKKILEQIQQSSAAYSLGLPVIEGVQRRESSYLLGSGFRHYQLLRAAGSEIIYAKILPAEECLNSCAVQAFRQGISTILTYDSTTREPYSQLLELKKHLKNHASPELQQLINRDAFLKSSLDMRARDLRTYLKESLLELMIKQLEIKT